MSSEMRHGDKRIFCMLRKNNLRFMLNQRSGTTVQPEDYAGILPPLLHRRISTKPKSD